MFYRDQLKILENRIYEKKTLIQVITGPRQVGKTTLANQFAKQTKIPNIFVSADAVQSSNSVWIQQQWNAARIQMKNKKEKSFLLIIDEIQKINNWSEFVKKEWDEDHRNNLDIKLILLGSSTLLINKGLSESLMGRFEIIKLPHWSYSEMKKAFGLSPEQYVYFGGYPGAVELIEDEHRWKDYIRNSIIEATISKDILQLTAIQKPSLLKNLFELACVYNGEILSYTKILGQLVEAGNTTTLTHYQNLLNQVWLISGLQKFSGSTIKTRTSPPKWISYNTALSSAYESDSFISVKNNPVKWGRKVEQIVGAYLLNSSRQYDFNIYYWRDGNDEVDFVLKKDNKIIALEVKSGEIKSYNGLNNFSKKYNLFKTILISKEGLNWKDFISLDVNEIFQ